MKTLLPLLVALSWAGISLTFFIFSMITGGAAVTGKIVNGHFYLGAHGNYPEVSRGIYVLSALLSGAMGLCLPIFAAVMEWNDSRKSPFNPFVWVGVLFASVLGLGFCIESILCIVRAFARA